MDNLNDLAPSMPEVGDNAGPGMGLFNVIIPRPFILAEQDKGELEKLREEALERVAQWETRMQGFFGEYEVFADSYRMISRKSSSKPRGIFNSKSGETHRATETMATLWFRMLTAHDPFFEGMAMGLNDWGMELTESDLYAVEGVLIKQLQKLHFKEKLLRGMNSLALFGTVIFEEPFVAYPYGDGSKWFAGTDLIVRPLINTAFDPFVFDIDMSDFMATIDFPTKWRMRNLASSDAEVWDKQAVEQAVTDMGDKGSSTVDGKTQAYQRVLSRKQRAGLSASDSNILENITYHGRLNIESPIIGALWDSLGRQDDPKYCDFTMGILNGDAVCRFHPTPYRTWHSLFKIAHYKLFELEGIGYGVGKIGRRFQREIDITQSQINNLLLMSVMSMWKVGRYAGLKANQLNIKPNQVIELEDIDQLEPLRPPIEAIAAAVNMMAGWKEDFRNTTGASANLQAIQTGSSATEAGITQNEAIRSGSVHAEIIAETMLREHLETCHQNNLDLLDEEIWVAITGTQKPMPFNKDNLPKNVGFRILNATDKDFGQAMLQNVMQGLQVATSFRNFVPETANVIKPLLEKFFRGININPRLLNNPGNVAEQLKSAMQQAQMNPQAVANSQGVPGQETQSEQAGGQGGGGMAMQSTPMGPVATSPVSNSLIQGV